MQDAPRKTIAISGLDPEEHATLKQLAETCGRTMSSMGLRALRFYARHVDEVERELRTSARGDAAGCEGDGRA
jgi:hypothetical protein